MLINLKEFHSIEDAGRVCMKHALEVDEINLPDYDRPTKEMKEVKLTPFQSSIIKYGLLTSMFNYMKP
jgi:hypothetical protein